MTISTGKTFFIPSGNKGDHLFFVILGPVDIDYSQKQQFISVNATTIRPDIPYDDACILNPGDHPLITHKSYIAYRYARTDTAAHLENMKLKFHADCSPELLIRIIDGAKTSRFIRRDLKLLFE